MSEDSKQRTDQQRKALELWCKMLAAELNKAGLDQRKVLKPGIEIPWGQDSVKKQLFKPILEAMTGHESSADAETTDYNKVFEVLSRHLASKLGVTVPAWPTKDREDMRT